MVAESTRRPNMSRLRGRLDGSPEGEYLPDAYSGYIRFVASVLGDWEGLQPLLAGGVNWASDSLLVEALTLVRGTPLGGFEFRWNWAEQMRSDMVSVIVDAAVALTDRCTVRWEHELADQAVSQEARAAGEVKSLMVRQIRLFAQCDDQVEADRQVLQLMWSAYASGRGLGPDSVYMIREVLQVHRQGPCR